MPSFFSTTVARQDEDAHADNYYMYPAIATLKVNEFHSELLSREPTLPILPDFRRAAVMSELYSNWIGMIASAKITFS
jgi:hypothetical protein